ncbi:hypothetical protein NDU88_005391 [Pleurodeles waltl]|uniref:Uncharacterized protein n=1 Tax=Pleurodeles waltl TaxID=8319 RepID=A0AAV7WUK8_PLEWA|nr:hypothetical protein NDU88_005391 [Pleurodeles waltl]
MYRVQGALNNLPRRYLGGRAPYEVLFCIPMYVSELDGSGVLATVTLFDINQHVTVLQEVQQFRAENSSACAATLVMRDSPTTPTSWIPKVGDLVQERIVVRKECSPSYRALVPVLGLHGTRIVTLPPLPGSEENRFVSLDNVKLHHVVSPS